jgi:hypothetical protein
VFALGDTFVVSSQDHVTRGATMGSTFLSARWETADRSGNCRQQTDTVMNVNGSVALTPNGRLEPTWPSHYAPTSPSARSARSTL